MYDDDVSWIWLDQGIWTYMSAVCSRGVLPTAHRQ